MTLYSVLALAYFLFFLAFVSCAHKPLPETIQDPSFRELSSEFRQFWKEASPEKDFEKKLNIFKKLIIQKDEYKEFYRQVVFFRKEDRWEAELRKSLKVSITKLPKNFDKINKKFVELKNEAPEHLANFRKHFPGASLDFVIYAVPSLGEFGGRVINVDLGKSLPKPLRKHVRKNGKALVVAFGIDKLVNLGVNSTIVFAHELFHVYHLNDSSPNYGSQENTRPFISGLFTEGLATFATTLITPNRPDVEYIAAPSTIKNYCSKDVKKLALKFSQEIEFSKTKSLAKKQKKSLYRRWFLGKRSDEQAKGVPLYAGYCIGLHVLKEMAKHTSVQEMAKWTYSKAISSTEKALKNFNKEI